MTIPFGSDSANKRYLKAWRKGLDDVLGTPAERLAVSLEYFTRAGFNTLATENYYDANGMLVGEGPVGYVIKLPNGPTAPILSTPETDRQFANIRLLIQAEAASDVLVAALRRLLYTAAAS